jgi:hypothetical protein
MVLQIIQDELKKYKEHIVSANYRELYKWEALKTFTENWNIDAENFGSMYEKSIHHEEGNLWASPHYFPRAVMVRLIRHDQEFVRAMFIRLFNEGESLDKRVERFVYDCEKIIKEVYEYDKAMIQHFHDGFRMVSLYLAFRFPEKYAIYKFTEFKKFMERVRAKYIPSTGEHERFFQVVRTIYSILKKDDELVRLHTSMLTPICYQGETLMLAQDFIFITARRYM